MDLGTKRKGMNMAYPSATKEEGEEEIIHQTVSLPLKLLKDIKVKRGDKIKICIEGEITAIEDNEYSSNFRMKAEEGEVLDNDEDDNENGTYLGGEEKE